MIDEAEAVNSKKRNEGIGLVSRADEDDEEDEDGLHGNANNDDYVSAQNRRDGVSGGRQVDDNDILNDVIKRGIKNYSPTAIQEQDVDKEDKREDTEGGFKAI